MRHLFLLFSLTCWNTFIQAQTPLSLEHIYDQPFVIRKSKIIQEWEIFQKATKEQSKEEEDRANELIWSFLPRTLNHTYISNFSNFPYYDLAISRQMPSFPREYSFQNISLQHLRNLKEETNDHPNSENPPHSYYYYSGNLMQEEFDGLRTQLKAKELFHEIEGLEGLTANIWISNPQVHATLHYDAVYNLFLQLAGRKKVLLRPPIDLLSSAMYGRNHPYACQSRWENSSNQQPFIRRDIYSLKYQRIFTNKTMPHCKSKNILDLSPSLDAMGERLFDIHDYANHFIEIILEPHDILFIPPFWLHETWALENSISLSFWWETDLMNVFHEWLTSPLPIEDYWKPIILQETIDLYLQYLIESFASLLSRHDEKPSSLNYDEILLLLKQLLQTRYVEDINCPYPIHPPLKTKEEKSKESFTPKDDDLYEDNPDEQVIPIFKVKNYARSLAKKIIEQFYEIKSSGKKKILEENMFTSASIEFLHEKWIQEEDTEVCEEGKEICFLMRQKRTRKQFLQENEIMILLVKLSDYIEEVFLFIARYLIETKPADYSHHHQASLSVALLHHWLKRL